MGIHTAQQWQQHQQPPLSVTFQYSPKNKTLIDVVYNMINCLDVRAGIHVCRSTKALTWGFEAANQHRRAS